jgi:PRTRC genetic system protein E
MFKELAPLFHQRSIVIMINPIEGDKLTIAILPKMLNDSENAALSTPVSVTGTPEELDEQLPSTLTQFVGAHLELKNTLELAKEEMARAAKAARQESKQKTTAKPEATTTNAAKPGDKKPATQPAKAAQPKTPPPTATANLFDFSGAPAPTPAPVATTEPAPVDAPAVDEDGENKEEEILSEIAEEPTEDELEDAA